MSSNTAATFILTLYPLRRGCNYRTKSSGLIQIKPVDKGGGFAIMNLSDYINEMLNQLNTEFTQEDGTT